MGATIPSSSIVLVVDEAYTRVEWLEIDGNDYEGNIAIDVPDPGGVGSVFQYLLIHDVENTPPVGQGDGFGISLGADDVTVRNSIVYEYGEDGIYASGTGIRVENSTFYRSTNTPNVGEAIQVTPGGSVTAENVIATDSAFYHDAGGTFVCNNSVSSDGSANDAAFGCTGTGNLVNRSAAASSSRPPLPSTCTSGTEPPRPTPGRTCRRCSATTSTARLVLSGPPGTSAPTRRGRRCS